MRTWRRHLASAASVVLVVVACGTATAAGAHRYCNADAASVDDTVPLHGACPSPAPVPSPLPSSSPGLDACHQGATYCALNPAVTQATARITICQVGWTATIRPPLAYTAPLKRQQLQQLGVVDLNPAHYEEDHRVPLELGGSPTDPANLSPERRQAQGGTAELKDGDENAARSVVCNGSASLAAEQALFIHKWLAPGLAYTH